MLEAREDEEQLLIRQLAAGDRAAWSRFVQRYGGLVYSRIGKVAAEFQIPLSPSDQEDICADVFAVLLDNDRRALKSFRGSARVSTWLASVTRRVCIRRLLSLAGRNARTASCSVDSDGLEPATSDSSGALQQIIRDEERARLRTAMRQLKPSDQQILTMFYLENLKYTDISNRLGIATNTVGPKLHRAQQRLRRILRNRNTDPRTGRFR